MDLVWREKKTHELHECDALGCTMKGTFSVQFTDAVSLSWLLSVRF